MKPFQFLEKLYDWSHLGTFHSPVTEIYKNEELESITEKSQTYSHVL